LRDPAGIPRLSRADQGTRIRRRGGPAAVRVYPCGRRRALRPSRSVPSARRRVLRPSTHADRC
jgi:hypothetical protein